MKRSRTHLLMIAAIVGLISISLSACGKSQSAASNVKFCSDAKANDKLQATLTTGSTATLTQDFNTAVDKLYTLQSEAPPEIKADATAVYNALEVSKSKIASANPQTPGGRPAILAGVIGSQAAELIDHGNKITAYTNKHCK